ncbi:MAG TPA: hypothetical protein VMT69_04080 [Kineosporiaceae bacterium]|nr:hypothetical protein [Kineosporiaceae bacterium]
MDGDTSCAEPATWRRSRGKLEDAGVEYQLESGTSIYFRDPDGARVELIADRLGEMDGREVRAGASP